MSQKEETVFKECSQTIESFVGKFLGTWVIINLTLHNFLKSLPALGQWIGEQIPL